MIEPDGIHDFRDGIMTGPLPSALLGTCKTDPLEVPTSRIIYCPDCQCGPGCAAGGSGAYALCIAGTWTCIDQSGGFCAGHACVPDGGACTNNIDCCSAVCLSGICTTPSVCDLLAQVAACPFFCDTINDCPCPSTTTTTTTTTAAPTTTTTETPTTTTTGSASTTTTIGTTTTTAVTTTTINFASTGFMFGQNLPALTVDRFNADGNTATVASGTSVILPAHGTGEQFSCRCNVTPFNQFRANHGGAFCGGGGGEPACPVWSLCLQQSNVPYEDSAYSDTALCCTISPTLSGCHDLAVGHHVDIKDGGLLTVHGTANSDPPDHCACDVEVHP